MTKQEVGLSYYDALLLLKKGKAVSSVGLEGKWAYKASDHALRSGNFNTLFSFSSFMINDAGKWYWHRPWEPTGRQKNLRYVEVPHEESK